MDRFVVNFDSLASAFVRGGQQQGQAGSERVACDKCRNELSVNWHAMRESPVK